MVGLSRISPIRMQSGAWRSAFLSPISNSLVCSDLALVHDRLLVLEDELDRVFQRQDVAGLALVAKVEHRCKRSRLARAGRADHEDQAALLHDHFLQHLRHAEGVDRRDAVGNVAHHHRGRALLAKSADAERADPRQVVGGVQLHFLFVLLDLALVQHFVQKLLHRLGGHGGLVDRHRHAVDLDIDRRAHRHEDVRRLLVGHDLEQLFHRGHLLPLPGADYRAVV
jgi:hypothetical protein